MSRPSRDIDIDWARRRAVEIHDETAVQFHTEYGDENNSDSPFRYGRLLIDRHWEQCVAQLPPRARCLDIGSGVGAYLARLIALNFQATGIEPSAEMRRLSEARLPPGVVTDGSVLELGAPTASLDFVCAIEVFRYLDTRDNALGHREINRVLRPGGIYFGTYVNKWALDGYRQLTQVRNLRSWMAGTALRYHVEFETPSSLRRKLEQAGFSDVAVHGAMFAPLRILHKLSTPLAIKVSKWTLPHEPWLSDRRSMRPFAGHLIAVARR